MRKGIVYAAVAYSLWGLFPLYFYLLRTIEPMQTMAHRIVWSLAYVALIWIFRGEWRWLLEALRQPRVVALFGFSAFCIALNWLVYIYAVNTHRVMDASLGYFISPLINVLCGALLLRERLRRPQWLAVGLACMGMLWLALQHGHWPWIALVLGLSFGLYGLLRKVASLNALKGFSLEVVLLFPCAFAYLGWLQMQGGNAFVQSPLLLQTLLIVSGPLTAIPLTLFAAGARRIPLATLGIMQYITPTMQFLLGLWVFHEPFGEVRMVGFMLIWLALLLYAADGVLEYRRHPT